MGADKVRKRIDRRQFLRAAGRGGLAALLARISGRRVALARAPTAQESPELEPPLRLPGSDELPHRVYLPFVSAPPVPHGPSKLGLHTVAPNGAVGFVEGVSQAGARVALIKALDNFGYLRLVKQISPQTITVARSNCIQSVQPEGDPASAAADVMAEHMQRWAYEKDVVDYWEVFNEMNPPGEAGAGHVWLAQFFIAAMDIAEDNGYKLALFSYSVGVPEWEEWEAIVATGVFARAQSGGHILALHEYNWPVSDYRWGEPLPGKPAYPDRGVLTGRYRHLYRDFLIPLDQVVPLAITECGLDPILRRPGQPDNHWQERYVETMIWYDDRLREDDYVLGAAMFTLEEGNDWPAYNYEALLPGFHDRIVALKDA